MNYYCQFCSWSCRFPVTASNSSPLHVDTSQLTESRCSPNHPMRHVLFGQNWSTVMLRLRTGAQDCNSAKNQESDWTLGSTGMSWLKSGTFAFAFMPFCWCWCVLMEYDFNFGNWKQMKYLLSDFFPLLLVLTFSCSGLLLPTFPVHPHHSPHLGLAGF